MSDDKVEVAVCVSNSETMSATDAGTNTTLGSSWVREVKVPSGLAGKAWLVQRCLTKEPRKRIQTALDIHNELEEHERDLSSGELVGIGPTRKRSLAVKWLGVATATLTVALVGTLFYFLQLSSDTSLRSTNPMQITSAAGVEDYPTWSPDGSRPAAVVRTGCWSSGDELPRRISLNGCRLYTGTAQSGARRRTGVLTVLPDANRAH